MRFFTENKKNGRAAPNRRPSWGCTKTSIFNKIPRKINNIRKSTTKQPEKNTLSTSLMFFTTQIEHLGSKDSRKNKDKYTE